MPAPPEAGRREGEREGERERGRGGGKRKEREREIVDREYQEMGDLPFLEPSQAYPSSALDLTHWPVLQGCLVRSSYVGWLMLLWLMPPSSSNEPSVMFSLYCQLDRT